MRKLPVLSCAGLAAALTTAAATAQTTVELVYEFDGNTPAGDTSFGTVEFVQNGGAVDVRITANTTNLGGGDINELYFNLPDTLAANDLILTNSGGTSDRPIRAFTLLGDRPAVRGGAGASFDSGVSFGAGGGPPGNGVLTAASFSLTTASGLSVGELLTQTSTPNNAPPVPVAVHFQGTSIFGQTSETVGGNVPEPASAALVSLGVAGLLSGRRAGRAR